MWYKEILNDSDVVVSSRVRYARNISNYKFVNLLNEKEFNDIIELIEKSINKNKYKLLNMKNIDEVTQNSLKEEYLISKEFVGNDNGAIITNEDNSLVCMVNEEDHLRMQAFCSGLNIDECYNKLKEFNDELERKINFSKSEKYGYLTACPTNAGSGMRVSLMLHLPALKESGMLSQVLEQVNNIGFSVRGIYGENSGSIGNMYQISNRKTLGLTDKEIIDNLKIVVTSIIEAERKARNILKENISFKDSVYRALGILKNARLITVNEAMGLLSNVRLGISTNIISEVTLDKIQSLMIEIQKNTLKLLIKEDFDSKEENIFRADYIRKELV